MRVAERIRDQIMEKVGMHLLHPTAATLQQQMSSMHLKAMPLGVTVLVVRNMSARFVVMFATELGNAPRP